MEQINELRPVSITTLTAVNSENWKWNEGVPSDPFGNNFSSGCNYAILTNSNYRYGYSIEYRTAEKYSSISGLLAPHTAMGEEGYCYVQIFADDVLVYTSPTVNRKTDAFSFDANVSGADYIKIKVYVEWSSSIIISDVSLYARAESGSEATDNNPNTNGDNTPKPISITTLNAINQENWNWNDGEPKDLVNGNYTSVCNYAILKNTNYRNGYSIEYRIDGNYEKLCGVYAPHTGMGEEGYAYIQVFADDVLIYTSQNVTKKTDANTFGLDIGGAKYIKIKVYVEWSSAIILSNVTLQ